MKQRASAAKRSSPSGASAVGGSSKKLASVARYARSCSAYQRASTFSSTLRPSASSKAQNELGVSGFGAAASGAPRNVALADLRHQRVHVAEVAQHDRAGRAQRRVELHQHVLRIRRLVLQAVARQQLRLGAADRLRVVPSPEQLEAARRAGSRSGGRPTGSRAPAGRSAVLERAQVAHHEAVVAAGHEHGDRLRDDAQPGSGPSARVHAVDQRGEPDRVLGLLAQVRLLGLLEVRVRVIGRQLHRERGLARLRHDHERARRGEARRPALGHGRAKNGDLRVAVQRVLREQHAGRGGRSAAAAAPADVRGELHEHALGGDRRRPRARPARCVVRKPTRFACSSQRSHCSKGSSSARDGELVRRAARASGRGELATEARSARAWWGATMVDVVDSTRSSGSDGPDAVWSGVPRRSLAPGSIPSGAPRWANGSLDA